MEEAIRDFVEVKGRPFLGICVGMQLATRGLEHEPTDGFGWIDGGRRLNFLAPSGLAVPPWVEHDESGQSAPGPRRLALGPDGPRLFPLHSYAFWR